MYPLLDRHVACADSSRTGAETTRLRIVASERADGDVHPTRVDASTLRSRQIAISGRAWTLLDERHGVAVVEAASQSGPTDLGAPADPAVTVAAAIGDIVVTSEADTHIAIWAADCAPLVLAADDGTLVGVHGGWRGLAAGIIQIGVDVALRDGGRVVSAVLGPVVHPCCYEFDSNDLASIPDGVTGVTSWGATALDVPATVAATLARNGLDLDMVGPCTGCDERWFSHRVRGDTGRHAVVAWWECVA